MQPAPTVPQRIMTREEYLAWVAQQPVGRFERENGVVLGMAPETVTHARAKAAMFMALHHAIKAANLPCEAFPDGLTVSVGEGTDYEPDAAVCCGPRENGEGITIDHPVIVVEVVSKSTRSFDNGTKLVDYFRVPSIVHYLLVITDRPIVIHHRRDGERIDTRLISAGSIDLDPPGLRIGFEDIFAWRRPT